MQHLLKSNKCSKASLPLIFSFEAAYVQKDVWQRRLLYDLDLYDHELTSL